MLISFRKEIVTTDVLERAIKRERQTKYRLLRKFRKARDMASKHSKRGYTCNFLRRQIRYHDQYSWIQKYSKNELAIRIFQWSERERNMFR